jgi:hypothetical protein
VFVVRIFKFIYSCDFEFRYTFALLVFLTVNLGKEKAVLDHRLRCGKMVQRWILSLVYGSVTNNNNGVLVG